MGEDLCFGAVEVRPAQRQVCVDGQAVPIGARAFDLLLALVERRDRVVTKAELLDLAWPGLVVEENNLSVQISALRKALGAQAIATVTGRGYRFTLTPEGRAPSPPGRPGAEVARRLATLVCGEIRAWQQRAAAAPQAAIAGWRALRVSLFEDAVPAAGGRIVELAAERMLFEFASPVEALRWVIDVHQRWPSQAALAAELRLDWRVAVCIEDVIIDDGRPVGEAVQKATLLLDGAPDDAGIVVAETVPAIVRERLPLRFLPLGDGRTGWRAEIENRETPMAVTAAPSLAAAQPDRRPSIAVLPFASPDDQAYFGDGITEEIIVSLAANRALPVIARSSTLRYRHSSLPPQQIAAELGVRYLLSGMVRRADSRLRLVVELIDAPAGRVIWSQRFDGADSDLFGFQSEIAARIAGAIDPRVTEAEIQRVALVPTESLGAYDCLLRGLALQVTFDDADFAAAGDFFRRAVALDPGYAQAHAHLAWWHNLKVGEGRSQSISDDARCSEQLSMQAMALDGRDALVLAIAAHIQGFVKRRLEVAVDMFEQALAINPSCAFGWCRSATAAAFLGRGDEAQQRVRQAMRLSPFDQQGFTFLTTQGTASLVLGRYDEAVAWYSKARRANPRYRAAWRMLVAALALAGELDEARAQGAEFMRHDPAFGMADFASWYAMREPHLGIVLRGMRLAGLPD